MGFCRYFFSILVISMGIKVGAFTGFDATISKLRSLAKQEMISLLAFDRAFSFLKEHAQNIENKNYVTIIDYSLPSLRKRLFIFDLRQKKIFSLFVAHGRGSGLIESTSFSNQINSFKSPLGFIKTGLPYKSSHVGLALNLYGLEEQNSQAYRRRIVLHGADYVGEHHIQRHGRLGRSLGCPAIDKKLAPWVIDMLKGGSLIYSFHS